jgi:hypothetical protein
VIPARRRGPHTGSHSPRIRTEAERPQNMLFRHARTLACSPSPPGRSMFGSCTTPRPSRINLAAPLLLGATLRPVPLSGGDDTRIIPAHAGNVRPRIVARITRPPPRMRRQGLHQSRRTGGYTKGSLGKPGPPLYWDACYFWVTNPGSDHPKVTATHRPGISQPRLQPPVAGGFLLGQNPPHEHAPETETRPLRRLSFPLGDRASPFQ